MRLRLFHWYRERTRHADVKSAEAEVVRRAVAAQWPEVLRHAEWARETRQRNHLTDLFFDFRGGKS